MKHFKVICIFIIIFLIIIIGGYFGIKYLNNKKQTLEEEYIPEEEINNEQNRQTIVSLYFLDIQTNEIIPEARLVDVSNLIKAPYDKIINLLIEGPKSDKLKSAIPEGVKLLGTNFSGDCVTINLSKEFLNCPDEESKNKAINTIVNSLTELTEVNSIKILIEGKENDTLKDIYVRI